MKQSDLNQRVKDLEHTQEVKDLKKQMEFMREEADLQVKGVRLECQKEALESKEKAIEEVADLKQESAAQAARIGELKVRLEEGPYKQLSEILKALVVKLPTLNISELAVSTKEK